jgi:hypothetical protein
MDKKPDRKYQEKWDERNGMISKSFKLKKELVDQFIIETKKRGDKQSNVIECFIKKYLDEKEN